MTDYLSRGPYLELLKNIIENKNTTSLSFAIDGDWGCGKTWIITELETQLSQKDEYLVFHYNAWKNDFYDEPIGAILSVLIERLNEVIKQKTLTDSIVDELLSEALNDLKLLVCGIVKEVTKIDIEESLANKKQLFKRIKQGTKISKDEIDNYIPLQNTLKIVRENLIKLSTKYKILLIVDELDRCLPEYAIKVLERLHHICNEIPVIQLLAINKKTLSDSIVKVFGKDLFKIDQPALVDTVQNWNEHFTDLYLQKFVDFIIPLSNGKLDSRLDILNKFNEEFVPFTREVTDGEPIKLDDEYLANFIAHLFSGIERRLQEKIISLTQLCHKLTETFDIPLEIKSYAILIYEIISCICRYVYHTNQTCKLTSNNDEYQLEFFSGFGTTRNPILKENRDINENLKELLHCKAYYNEAFRPRELFPLTIIDTTTFLMTFFYDKRIRYDNPSVLGIWNGIQQDKVFLNKFDEIMNMLVIKDNKEIVQASTAY